MKSLRLKLGQVGLPFGLGNDGKENSAEKGTTTSPKAKEAKDFQDAAVLHENQGPTSYQYLPTFDDEEEEQVEGEFEIGREQSAGKNENSDDDDEENDMMWQISPVGSQSFRLNRRQSSKKNLPKEQDVEEKEAKNRISPPIPESETAPSQAQETIDPEEGFVKETIVSSTPLTEPSLPIKSTKNSDPSPEGNLEEEKMKNIDDGIVPKVVPSVVNLPEEMWVEAVKVASRCWQKVCHSTKVEASQVFSEVGVMLGFVPLGPRNDPDVVFCQLMKDIKRETVQVNGELFVGGSAFDSLYNALEKIVLSHNDSLTGTPLEHKVQRILRGCSRTVSGYDAYDIVSALMNEAVEPKALVTPAMMDNSPITIDFKEGSDMVILSSVNVFKVSRELEDGSLATVVVFKTEVTEQIELEKWTTVRWMSLKPLDKAEECANPILLFRDRTLAMLLDQTKTAAGGDTLAHNKALFELISSTKTSLNQAIEQTIKSIKTLADAEYQRGYQAALSKKEAESS